MSNDKRITYVVRTAVGANVCRQRNGSAEAEDNAERIHGDVDDRNAELVDEASRQEV
jgi:hypothetical protein